MPVGHYSLSSPPDLSLTPLPPQSLPYLNSKCLHDKIENKNVTKLCKRVSSIK